jgi:hypothetical protein
MINGTPQEVDVDGDTALLGMLRALLMQARRYVGDALAILKTTDAMTTRRKRKTR